jgi:hypothetical protein
LVDNHLRPLPRHLFKATPKTIDAGVAGKCAIETETGTGIARATETIIATAEVVEALIESVDGLVAMRTDTATVVVVAA